MFSESQRIINKNNKYIRQKAKDYYNKAKAFGFTDEELIDFANNKELQVIVKESVGEISGDISTYVGVFAKQNMEKLND